MSISDDDINEQPADDGLPPTVAGDADGTDSADSTAPNGDSTAPTAVTPTAPTAVTPTAPTAVTPTAPTPESRRTLAGSPRPPSRRA